MTMLTLSPFTKGRMYYRVTWYSPNARRRVHADYRSPLQAEACWNAISMYLPDSRPTCGPVIA